MKKTPYSALLPLIVTAIGTSALLACFVTPAAGLMSLGVTGVAGCIAYLMLRAYHNRLQARMDDVLRQNESAAASILSGIDVPALIFNENARIIWSNKAFRRLYGGNDLRRILPELDTHYSAKPQIVPYNGRSYEVISTPIRRDNPGASKLTFQYWMDRTEALHYSRLYEEQMPAVALLYVDNYEDLMAHKQFQRNSVLAEIERYVSEFAASVEGIYRRYDNAKFIVVFEAKYAAELEKSRFPILDAVRSIETGTGQPATLSLAVGLAERILRSDEAARQGMELALGRGGDQAVVKRGTSYSFYGGKRQVTTHNSRVKTRLFAKAFRQLLENADQVFVMGHRNYDMDCIGAALAVMRCASFVGCRAYLVLDEVNVMIKNAIQTMQSNSAYRDAIKTPEQAFQLMRASSAVMVLVDTQRRSALVSPELYDRASKTVIIDHHRKPTDAFTNPTLSHLEAGASSVSEMMTEVVQYFDDALRLTAFECGALLAGITVDTKRFAFNTGARTFEAASYLRRNGADNNVVKLMFQDDMQSYRDRAKVVESTQVMEHGIAIAACPEGLENAALIAAQAADELVSMKGINAAFVLSHTPEGISVSGRSLGDISVQLILETLGGGGHLAVAGAQLRDETMEGAIARLKESIRQYFEIQGNPEPNGNYSREEKKK